MSRQNNTRKLSYYKGKKKKKKQPKKLTYKMQANFLFVFCVILFGFFFLTGRLVFVNKRKGDDYERKVLSQQSYVSGAIPYQRGSIIDRNGAILAKSDKVYNLILDPKVLLQNKECIGVTLEAISEIFEMDYQELLNILDEKETSSYVIIKKQQTYEKKVEFDQRVEKQKLADRVKRIIGVWFEDDYVRSYPYGNLASHLIGFANSGNAGMLGVEQYYNNYLNGTNGRTYGYYDAELNLERTVKSAINGYHLVTTIDIHVQKIVQEKVDQFIDKVGCENIGVILMNPNNGEIYSMVSNSGFDLNNPRDLSNYYLEDSLALMSDEEIGNARDKLWRNFCVADMFEPGSTFKPFTVAAALEEDLVTQNTTFSCTGYRTVGGWNISCNNKSGHGHPSLAESLMKSCNPALMDIGERLGRERFIQYQLHFGFGKKTGIDISSGEADGMLVSIGNLNVTELATSSFGQGFTVNMVQLISSFASLVNGGYYYQPHIVKEIVNENGATIEEHKPLVLKETVSTATSEFIKEAMYLTVENGTAKPAKVEGYLIGGKTGTAQKLPRKDKKYVVSFVGCVPANDPELVIYVVIDEIHDEEKKASSSVATELTSEILSEVLPFLGIYPEGEINYRVELPQNLDDIVQEEEIEPLQEENQIQYDSRNDESNPDSLPDDLD